MFLLNAIDKNDYYAILEYVDILKLKVIRKKAPDGATFSEWCRLPDSDQSPIHY